MDDIRIPCERFVLIRVTVTVIKHHQQMQLGGGKGLFYLIMSRLQHITEEDEG